MAELVAAVDVGTGSARAGIFAADGRMLGRAERAISTRLPDADRAEQDSEAIWAAACAALRAARAEAGAAPEAIAGLAFDATCSLVLRGRDGRPLPASDGRRRWDTMLWLDHRARAEALAATATGHSALASAGGALSPEMQLPKLMWLKRRAPDRWAALGQALDLADFLAWRAAGSEARSLCALACKWTLPAPPAIDWPEDFLEALGLADVAARCGLPAVATPVGTDLGPLLPAAADALGLTPRARVGVGMIDGHAGALGVLGALDDAAREAEAALIGGTSACIMTLTRAPRAAPGLWGPAQDAILPGLSVAEGGLSAAGALLDRVLRLGGGAPTPARHARVWARIAELHAAEGWELGAGLHVLPDLRGLRGPAPDPRARGAVIGLGLDATFDGLCRLYWRAAVGLALGLADVLAALEAAGRPIRRLHAGGGHARNPGLLALYAAATCRPVTLRPGTDAVLLGTAMAAAAAAGLHPGLAAAARAMGGPAEAELAPDPEAAVRLARDSRILAETRAHLARVRALEAVAPDARSETFRNG